LGWCTWGGGYYGGGGTYYGPAGGGSSYSSNSWTLFLSGYNSGDGWIKFTSPVAANHPLCDIAASTGGVLTQLTNRPWKCTAGQPTNNANVCSWSGVVCTAGTVEALRLSKMGLVGSISSSIGRIYSVSYLELSYNQLTNVIPTALGSLPLLTRLSLDGNSLTGSLPTSFGLLTALKILHLAYNSLTNFLPPEIGGMTSLEQVYLQANLFSQNLPTALGLLTNLVTLHLSHNYLDGFLPSEIASMTVLTSLSLNNNALSTTLPSEIGNMTNLVTLSLQNNQFSGSVPASYCNLNPSIGLSLTGNPLTCMDSCFLKNTLGFVPDFVYKITTCFNPATDVYLSPAVVSAFTSNECPGIYKTSRLVDYCSYFSGTNCVYQNRVQFGGTCPPQCVRSFPSIYCTMFAKLYYTCGVNGMKLASVSDVDNMASTCLATFVSKLSKTTVVSAQLTFNLTNIDSDILRAHKTMSDQSAYRTDKDMIASALSTASGLPTSAFNNSMMSIAVDDDIVLRRRLSSAVSGSASAVVSLTVQTVAQALSSSQGVDNILDQFLDQISSALNTQPVSMFLQVLRSKYIEGTSTTPTVQSGVRSMERQDSFIPKVSILTPDSGNQPTNQITGGLIAVTSNPTSKPTFPTFQPSRAPTVRPTAKPSSSSSSPSKKPTRSPSAKPLRSVSPTTKPTRSPSTKPTRRPTTKPTRRPSTKPSRRPTMKPSKRPTAKPK